MGAALIAGIGIVAATSTTYCPIAMGLALGLLAAVMTNRPALVADLETPVFQCMMLHGPIQRGGHVRSTAVVLENLALLPRLVRAR